MAKKKAAPRKSSGFNFLDDEGYIEQVKESLMDLRSKRKDVTIIQSYAEVGREYIDLPNHFLWQAATNMRGLPHRSLIEIIAEDGIGKTSLIFTLLGACMARGCPSMYVETETKHMDNDRVARCMSENPELGRKLMGKTSTSWTDNVVSAVEIIEDWVTTMRTRMKVPITTPLVVALDSFSKLMSQSEAVGRSMFKPGSTAAARGKSGKKKKSGTNEGSNLGHAKFAAAWCRGLPTWLNQNNVVLLVVSHQNAKVDMNAMPGFSMGAEQGKLYNRTKIGGGAFNQNASLQIILAAGAAITNGSDKVGYKVRCNVIKNSFGAKNVKFEYDLVQHPFLDDPDADYWQPVLWFDQSTAQWLAMNGLLGVKESDKRYSSEELGVRGASARELMQAIHADPATIERLGSMLGVKGYSQAQGVRVAQARTDAEPEEEEADDEEV